MRVPDIGQCVLVRKRPAVVRNKIQSPGTRFGQKTHLLDVDYLDTYNYPGSDTIVWEREVGAAIYALHDFPNIFPPLNPDKPSRFHAFIDAISWSAQGVYEFESDKKTVSYTSAPLSSPWFSAVQVEDYQLYPVLQALNMPRVNLLLADDVGLGKTIEAGLIIQELIRQRRIRRILIVCPASLQIQWQDEMKEKFNISFEILDSEKAWEIQRTLGMDANPWKVYPRLITSMDYLKQIDILDRFKNTSLQMGGSDSAMLPWDLLIVDEAHNYSPSRFSDDSQRCSMLRDIAPFFEHRLFLTATPHNGYTVSFSGLLELLDPVRFQQKAILSDDDYKHLNLVMIRRMKSELNEGRNKNRFPTRTVDGLGIIMSEEETRLFKAIRRYLLTGTSQIGRPGSRERNLAQFIVMLLNKRLLSSSYAFAQTWWNHVAGFDLDSFGIDEADESRRRALTEIENDEEKDLRECDVARHGAGWLKQYVKELRPYLDEVSVELNRLGWGKRVIEQDINQCKVFPKDTRFERLFQWIEEKLMEKGKFKGDERVIIFTEYKDTLDYLVARFKEKKIESPVIQLLFGGADAKLRREVKENFNDPASPLRILIATDAASEGLNLQTSCRYLIHQEIPWNPMRLEQRNGRVDRHGQSRDVFVWHFVSDQVEDLKFLDFVTRKVDTVRGDLGSIGNVLDEAVMEYFSKGTVNTKEVERRVALTQEIADDKRDLSYGMHGSNKEYTAAYDSFLQTQTRLGLSEVRLVHLLDEAIKLETSRSDQSFLSQERAGVFRFSSIPAGWKTIIQSSLLLDSESGAQPKMVFSPERVMAEEHGRMMFHPGKDTRLLMLGHPVMQKALSSFTRRMWLPSSESKFNKWTMEQGELPGTIEAVYTLYYQIALRNKLGERMDTGILRVPVIVEGGKIRFLSSAEQDEISQINGTSLSSKQLGSMKDSVISGYLKVKQFAESFRSELTGTLFKSTTILWNERLEKEIKANRALYSERKNSLDRYNDPKHIKRLKSELEQAIEKTKQLTFDPEQNLENRLRVDDLKADLEFQRQSNHVVILKKRLEKEEQRVITKVLPRRYSLDEEGVEIMPVAVHILVSSREVA